jgi:hypothetical protein
MMRQRDGAGRRSGSDTAALALFDDRELVEAAAERLTAANFKTAAIAVAGYPHSEPSGSLATALHGFGIPRDLALQYEDAIRSGRYLIIVHGVPSEVERAREILQMSNSSSVDVHEGLNMSPATSRHHRQFFVARWSRAATDSLPPFSPMRSGPDCGLFAIYGRGGRIKMFVERDAIQWQRQESDGPEPALGLARRSEHIQPGPHRTARIDVNGPATTLGGSLVVSSNLNPDPPAFFSADGARDH